MDDELRQRSIQSPILETEKFKKQKALLNEALEEAQKKVDFYLAHDPQIQKAIEVVEMFLRKSNRPCYGGQAINAHLPSNLKFYEVEYDLPDYDFFSPDPESDTKDLIAMLKKEGFDNIEERSGVHEGTKKLYANYTAIADITYLNPYLYKKINENKITVAGVSYVGADILRMNMYLELSRPRGEVKRWSKVFERLTLLNHAKPTSLCRNQNITFEKIDPEIREKIIQYLILKKRILAGPEIAYIYKKNKNTPENMNWIIRSGGPVLFFSPNMNLEKDIQNIRDILQSNNVEIQIIEGYQDILPKRVLIKQGGKPVAYLVDEVACSSYNEIKLDTKDSLRIGSPDTLSFIYLMISLLTDDDKVLEFPVNCFAQKFIQISDLFRDGKERFPGFSVRCAGHQKTILEILKDREDRREVDKEKKKKDRAKRKEMQNKEKGKEKNKNKEKGNGKEKNKDKEKDKRKGKTNKRRPAKIDIKRRTRKNKVIKVKDAPALNRI
jgi:Poly(A) polymerase catalytic subunit